MQPTSNNTTGQLGSLELSTENSNYENVCFIGSLAPATRLLALAALYTSSVGNVNGSGTPLNLAIPDANPSGISSSMTLETSPDNMINNVTVTLNISGGWNGDLYAYLSYNGTLVMLLNQVGAGSGSSIQSVFGFSTSGLNNITLADGSPNNIHDVQSPVSGTAYAPDDGSLSSFNEEDPNGTWTIFFADLSAGNTATLQGWSLDITAVPEPANVALILFGGLLGIGSVVRRKYTMFRRRDGVE